jgi:membrane-bound metal-dependent hydrolase YbcI (DUF457 family)
MGRSHAVSGGVAFLAPASVLNLSPWTLLLGASVCAGAAVLPDIDHPGSGVSRTFGPVTQTFASVVGKLSGGHRNGTHSYAGAGVFSLLAFTGTALYAASILLFIIGVTVSAFLEFCGWYTGVTDSGKGRGKPAYKKPWHGKASAFTGVLMTLSISVTCILFGRLAGAVMIGLLIILVLAAMIRPMKIKGKADDFAPIPIAAALLYWHADLTVVPYAITLGVLIHICGDQVTVGGCPTGWPKSQTMKGLGLFKTNSPFENHVVFPALWVLLILFAALNTGVLGALT